MMTRFQTATLLALLVAALGSCEQTPSSYDYHGGAADGSGLDLVAGEDLPTIPPADAETAEDQVGTEVPEVADGLPDSPGDAEEPPEETVTEETVTNPDEPPVPDCEEALFTYQAAPGVGEVLVSGSFNDWAEDAAGALVMSDHDGDGLWWALISLSPGSYQYKFVVDGEWLPDPNNPNQVDDTYGGFNSVVTVLPCPEAGALSLVSHATDGDSGTFTAELTAAGDTPLEPDDVSVTVDWEPVSDGVTVAGQDVNLELTGLAPGIHDVRVTCDGETVLLKVYVGLSTDWREAILYFVMTDRFANGDQGNDAPVADVGWETNYQGGDFAGVTQQIEAGYFDDLGVGALWLSWPVDNPDGYHDGGRPAEHVCGLDPKTAAMTGTRYTGYHGYWPGNLYETDEHFGTLEELQQLVTTAHAHGIRILLDFTANHVHESSPFYQEHQEDDFFHFPAEICQDVGWDDKPVTCWFTEYLPDLNYSNPAAVDAVLDYAMWWARQSGCDGFRLDAVKHIEFEFVQALRQRVHQELELTGIDFYIVGETFTGDTSVIKSFIGPDKIHGQFDFPANMAVLKGFAKHELGLEAMDSQVRSAKGDYGAGALMSNFIGNHDIARFVSMAAGSIACGIWDVQANIAQGWLFPPAAPDDSWGYEALRLAFTYIMTIPGVPLIYYGDEFGMPGAGDPDNRRMMRFGNELSPNETATLAFLQTLGQARRDYPVLAVGDWTEPLWSEGEFLAYGRTMSGQRAVILINRGQETRSGELNLLPTAISGGTKMTDVLSGTQATVSNELKLAFEVPARAAAIFITD